MGGFSPAARESGRPVAGGARRQWRRDAARAAVSRIAVHPTRQREGLGRKMIADIAADAAGYDSPSASAIPLSCGASGNAAGLPSYGWVPIARPAAAIRRWPSIR
ncbi:GNAT family N-acetyltransferase [Klebsiella pneumoniae]|uniref:GNAT family N-acetyltransferase n=1 Tax=Klebsiella pneumoniae TaxID=573 RepID=UPI00396F5722